MPPPRILSGALLVAVAVAGCGGSQTVTASGETTAAVSDFSLTVTPPAGGKHDRFTVTIRTRHAVNIVGKTRRAYLVEAHAVRPASACVNSRDRAVPYAPAGARVSAVLDPLRGEGGPEGWCPGLFRGSVTDFEGFACPSTGSCHPPRGFPTRTRVVARFSFRVR